MGQKTLNKDVKLLSIFKTSLTRREKALFTNYLYNNHVAPRSKAPMTIDPSKIILWKEYFCRYDDARKEFVG